MKPSLNGMNWLKPNTLTSVLKRKKNKNLILLPTERMVIKPMDVILMLDSEDMLLMDTIDLHKLCILATLDLQIETESYAKHSNNRRNLC